MQCLGRLVAGIVEAEGGEGGILVVEAVVGLTNEAFEEQGVGDPAVDARHAGQVGRRAGIKFDGVAKDIGTDRGGKSVSLKAAQQLGLDARATPVDVACGDQVGVGLGLPDGADDAREEAQGTA